MPESTRIAPCLQPHEIEARGERTLSVGCDAPGAALRGPARVLFGLGIDPNRASAATLEALPGIGPARAAAIVAGRASGPYCAAADLVRVRGLGPVTVGRLEGWLDFAGCAGAGPGKG